MSQPPPQEGDQQAGPWDFLTRWVIFVLAVTALPAVVGTIIVVGTGKGTFWPGVVGSGELAAGALAITADAVGSVTGKGLSGRRFLAAGLTSLWLLFTTFTVTLFLGHVLPKENDFAAWLNSISWGVAFVLGITCKIIAEGPRKRDQARSG